MGGGLSGLSGLSGLTGVAGGGSAAPVETFDLLYKVGSNPATNVKGRHTLTYDGNTTGNFVDYLSAAAAKALFEQVYTTVTVSLIDKGYRVRVAAPTGNLANPMLTPSTTYTLNDETGTAPNKTSQRDYSAGVSAVKEQFTFNTPIAADTETTSIGNGSLNGTVIYDNLGVITSDSPPFGFTSTAGGVGTNSTTWTQSSPEDIVDFTITLGPGSLSAYTQGVTAVSAVNEEFTVDTTGNSGDVITSSGIIISFDGAGDITAITNASGFTVVSGGIGFGSVRFSVDAAGARTDETIFSSTTSGGDNIFLDVQGSDAVSGVAEQFTYTTAGVITRSAQISNDAGSTTRTITWTSNLISAISANPSGYSVLDGGIGEDFVQFEQDTGASGADYVIHGDGLGASVNVDQQGVTGVAEVIGRCVISYSGGAGYFTFADGFTALPIPVTTSEADMKTLLNGVGGYNDAIVGGVVNDGTEITISYVAGEQPAGTITIGGATGAAVVASIVGVSDGA